MRSLITLLSIACLSLVANAHDQTTLKIQPRSAPPGMKSLSFRELGEGLAPGRRPLSILLMNAAIVEEINLSDEQRSKIDEIRRKHEMAREADAKDFQERAKAAREQTEKALSAPDLTNADRVNLVNNSEMMALSRENTEKITRLSDELDSTITKKVLDRTQAIRLRQIQAQAEGTSYFQRPEIREKLALEPEQIAEIERISNSQRDHLRAALMIPSKIVKPEPNAESKDGAKAYSQALDETRNKVARLRVSTMKAIEKTLTNPQRGAYKTLVGEPFIFFKPTNDKYDSSK